MRFHSAVPIGRGGTGRVLRAYDVERGHDVALKVLHVSTPSLIERLRREAAALARLDHPNIARIYGSGEQDGQPYISMQLIDGVPLDQAAAALNLEQRIALLVPVVDAIQAAHRAGLVHRDLKPANLLVETQADGSLKPYVVDFGLVHGGDEAPTVLTEVGEFLGTPGYLSPEQAAGEGNVDRRSDVFSLGVILYELACRRAPFTTDSLAGTVVRLLRHEPPPPHRVDGRVPLALSRIVRQCLEKEPARRYQSARALKEDLEAWLDGRPVRARHDRVPARLARWLRRSPARAAALVLALALPLAAATTWLHGRIESARIARLVQDYATTAVDIARDLDLAAMRPDQDLALHRARALGRLAPLREAIDNADRNVRRAAAEALGRALFALGQIDAALEVLEPAWHEGPRSATLAALLGRVRERAYAERVAMLSAIGDAELRRARWAELRRDSLQPALALFELAHSESGGSDARIGQALIAFHQGRSEQAQAILAAINEPSLAAEQLAAQLRLDHALTLFDDADPVEVEAALSEAQRAFSDLVDTARSQPAAHLGLCRIAALRLRLISRIGSEAVPPGQIEACDRALRHDSLDPGIRTASALAYGALARRQVMLNLDPVAAVERVRHEANASGQVAAALALGQSLVSASDHHRNRGEAADELLNEAEAVLSAAGKMAPGEAALQLELGAVQQMLAIHGRGDRDPAFARAAQTLESALVLHDNLSTRLRLAEVLTWWGNERYHTGQAPDELLSRAIALLAPEHERLPDDLRILQRLAFAHWTLGQYLAATGIEADADLEAAERLYDRVLAVDPGRRSSRFNRLSVQFTLARHRLQRGDSAAQVLARAEAGFPGLDSDPDDLGLVVQAGALRLLQAREHKRSGGDARADFAAARQLLGRALTHPRDRSAAASQLADLIVSAQPDDFGDDIFAEDLQRLTAVREEFPDNRVLALHHARLLALAARREPERWLQVAQNALAEVRQHSGRYLAPFAAEFAGLEAPE